MPTYPTFDFPYHETIDTYPESSQTVAFGGGYSYASRPFGPDQLKFTLKFPAMWVYETSGAVNETFNANRNLWAFIRFYERVRLYDIFQYNHPRRGLILCRFSKPIVTPRIIPGRLGLTEPFDIELIEVPFLSSDDIVVDPDVKAIISNMVVAPSLSRQALISYVVSSLKSSALWNKISRLYIPAAHTEQAGCLDWKNPAIISARLVKTGSPTFATDRGMTGLNATGSTNYYVGPTTVGDPLYTSTNASWFSWIGNNPGGVAVGAIGSFNSLYQYPRYTNNLCYLYNGGSTSYVYFTNTNSVGFYQCTRLTGIDGKGFKNGVLKASSSTWSTGIISGNISVAGAPGSSDSSAHQVALLGIGASMTDSQSLQLYEIFRDYMQAIGVSI